MNAASWIALALTLTAAWLAVAGIRRRALTTELGRIFFEHGPARWGLFDLASDPLESQDLAGTHKDELAELLRAWDEYAVRNGVILPTRDMGYGLEPLP